MGELLRLIEDRGVVVVVGTGGVGKTTTSAALGMAAARTGRRVVVVTVDPARRLADTLASGPLGNDPVRVEIEGPGELWAAMLDPKATFDDLVRRHSQDAAQVQRILSNKLYQTLSSTFGGTHEYMAVEKLHGLRSDDRFDLVVVDTPPSGDVLTFLDSPRLLVRLFDSWLYRSLVPARAVARAASSVVQGVVRPLTRVVGTTVVEDTVAFFRAFDGMEAGFRQRALETSAQLRSDDTAFVLVSNPRADSLEQAERLAGQLVEFGVELDALVVNLVQPAFGAGSAEQSRRLLERLEGTPCEDHARALHEARVAREVQLALIAESARRLGVGLTVPAPDLGEEVSVDRLARALAETTPSDW